MMKTRTRSTSGLLLGLALCLPAAARAADTDGLDLTIEVLGKNERIDDRIVNRIPVPGVQLDPRTAAADAHPGVDPSAVPLPPLDRPSGVIQDLGRGTLDLLRPRQDSTK